MLLWEKYRPKTPEEYIGKEKFMADVVGWSDNDELPHLMLHGPAGSGKSAFAIVIGRYNLKENFKKYFKTIDGSTENKVEDIRRLVSKIALSKRGVVRIYFIDEAERLTEDSWKALKVCLEKYGYKARFIFATNDIQKIMKRSDDAITSRCYVEKFEPHTVENMRKMVTRVLESEGVGSDLTDAQHEVLEKMVELSAGDMRTLINTYLKRFIANPNITLEDLKGGKTDKIIQFLEKMRGKIIAEKDPYKAMNTLLGLITKLREKISANDIIAAFTKGMRDLDVAEFAGWVALFIRSGVPEEIAMTSFASKITKVLRK